MGPVCAVLLFVSAQNVRDTAAAIDEAVAAIPGFNQAAAAADSDDGEFLRRLMLDLAGRPPTLDETRRFLADKAENKRAVRLDEIVDSDAFADPWARRLAAMLLEDRSDPSYAAGAGGVLVRGGARASTLDEQRKARTASGGLPDGISSRFVDWLREQIREDRPYTEVAREIIAARGKTSENPALAYRLSFFRGRSPEPAATQAIVRHFLGINLYCARCHDHAYDRWTVEQYSSMVAFGVRLRARGLEELTEADEDAWPADVNPGADRAPRFFLTGVIPDAGESRSDALARLVTKDAQFSRAVVNRVWAWLLGRGIVDPVDDFNLRDRPLSPRLLALLARDFERQNRSLKFLVRAICMSRTWQRSCAADGELKRHDFSRALVRPLGAELLGRSIEVATGARVPELAPPSTATELALFMRNSAAVRRAIREGGVLEGIRKGSADRIESMFLAALSRRPTERERERVAAFVASETAESYEDAYWALLNTPEFLSRH